MIERNIRGSAGSNASRLGAFLLMVVGGLVLVISIIGMLPSDPIITLGGLVFLMVLGAVLAGAGVYWLRSVGSSEEGAASQRDERAILDLAMRKGGAVTLVQAVQELRLPPATVETILEQLTKQRLMQPELLEDGSIEYRVRGMVAQ